MTKPFAIVPDNYDKLTKTNRQELAKLNYASYKAGKTAEETALLRQTFIDNAVQVNKAKKRSTAFQLLTPIVIGATVAFTKTDASVLEAGAIGLGTLIGKEAAGFIPSLITGNWSKSWGNQKRALTEEMNELNIPPEDRSSYTKQKLDNNKEYAIDAIKNTAKTVTAWAIMVSTGIFGGIKGYEMTKDYILKHDKAQPKTEMKDTSYMPSVSKNNTYTL